MTNPSNLPELGRAVIFNGHGKPFEYITRQTPDLNKGEILVKVLYTTLCGSDIHTFCGRRVEPPQVVLGHEIVGKILRIDADHSHTDARHERLAEGDIITWSIFSVPPGAVVPRVDMPQKSQPLFKYGHALASGKDVFNGGLADYCILKNQTFLVKLPAGIPLKVAATISCAHATVAGALRVAGTISGKRVLVFGAGMLGLSCLAMCREAGASWIGLVDREESRMSWAWKFGVNQVYDFESSVLADKWEWPESDLVFDMTGNPDAMKAGIDSLSIGGTAVWIGAVFPERPVPVDAQKIVRKILQIKGLHNYNLEDFLYATQFITDHYAKYPFENLVEKEYSLTEVPEAFSYASQHKPVRVGIRIESESPTPSL